MILYTYNMSLILEGLQRVGEVPNTFHIINNHPPISVAPDVFAEQRALPTAIKKKAHIIAGNVRNRGEQKFGPM